MPRNLNQKQASATQTNATATATIAAPGLESRLRAVALIASFSAVPAAAALLTIGTDNTGTAVSGAGNRVILAVPLSNVPLVFTAEELAAIRGDRNGTLYASLAPGGAAVVGGVYIAAVYEGA